MDFEVTPPVTTSGEDAAAEEEEEDCNGTTALSRDRISLSLRSTQLVGFSLDVPVVVPVSVLIAVVVVEEEGGAMVTDI